MSSEPETLSGGSTKEHWQSVVATLTHELRSAADRAEGYAKQIRAFYPNNPADIQHARTAYTEAMSEYNGLSDEVQVLLVTAKQPPTKLDTSKAVTLLNAFEVEYHKLFDHLPQLWAAVIPSLGDIAKIIDSIMGIFKYFVDRKDRERHDVADLLATFELREWDHAGDPRPARQSTAKAPEKKTASGKKDSEK